MSIRSVWTFGNVSCIKTPADAPGWHSVYCASKRTDTVQFSFELVWAHGLQRQRKERAHAFADFGEGGFKRRCDLSFRSGSFRRICQAPMRLQGWPEKDGAC